MVLVPRPFWFSPRGRSWPVAESGGPFIDQVYVLQSYAEGWKEGTWEEKVDERPCLDPLLYSPDKHEYYRCGWAGPRCSSRGGRVARTPLPSGDLPAAGCPPSSTRGQSIRMTGCSKLRAPGGR